MRRIGIEIVADYSQVTKAFSGVSRSAKNFDRDLSHTARGVVAGSGVFTGLGRSLAFASGGFLAFAGVSSSIRNSIEGAEKLEKAQRGLSVAIKHTGGDLKTLKPQYEATAQSAAKFGQNQADATTALERATVLTGDATKAQHAYEEALVISKATGKDFNAVLTATAKGQEGVTTSLQRYGILIKKGTPGQEQFNAVMARFGGQAKANTSTIDRFNATWQNTEEIIGTAILPALNKLLTSFTDWLTKMQKSGRLQHDVNIVMHDAGDIFHALKSVIRGVDRVTGSFTNTLKTLLALGVAYKLVKWATAIKGVATAWGLVKTEAAGAAAAEATAAGTGAADAAIPGVSARVAMYTGGAVGAGEGALGAVAPALLAPAAVAALGANAFVAPIGPSRPAGPNRVVLAGVGVLLRGPDGNWYRPGPRGVQVPATPAQAAQANAIASGGLSPRVGRGSLDSVFGRIGGALGGLTSGTRLTTAQLPPHTFTQQFGLTAREQLVQAQSALTRSTTDDVAAAKQVVARVKRLIAEGRLKGKAMIQALGLEANALSTIWSAEDAAAQKRAQAAAKAKARIAAQIQNSIDPAKLELNLARDQALGRSTVKDLLALKRAAEKALASGKLSIQQQIQAYQQIASINQQLSDSATGALGGFKQANTRKLTAGLGLTHAQQKALRARLSQLGPGGTTPGDGTGAFGFVIGADGRVRHRHHHPSDSATASGGRGNNATLIRHVDKLADRPIDVNVYLDGHPLETTVTRRQQKRRRRSSSQRRGPNAGG